MNLRITSLMLWCAVAIFALFSTACDSFLSVEPDSFVSTENVYQTPQDFEAAVNASYDRLRNQAGVSTNSFANLAEIRFDGINRQFNVSLPGDGAVVEEWQLLVTNPFLQGQWSSIYNTITQTNIILSRIGNVEFTNASQRSRLEGEAKFIRALSYWYAVQFWGDVPLVTDEIRTPNEVIPEEGRTPRDQVLTQIIADLQDAVELLPSSAQNPGRATEGAAKFLLGRTYLITGDYSEAINALEDVETGYGYDLVPDFGDIWHPGNTNNGESIFELQFGANVPGQPHADMIRKILPWTARGEIVTQQVNTTGWMHPSYDLIELFVANDNVNGNVNLPIQNEDMSERFQSSIWWYEIEGNASHSDVAFFGDSIGIINKFYWPDYINDQGQQEGNDILFRYADALLSLAEAYWREDPAANQNAILSLLNRVRERAGLPEVNLNNVPVTNLVQGTYLETDNLGRAIFNERTVELFAEGHRYFDLKRFEVALEVMQNYADTRRNRESRLQNALVIEPFKLLFPLPAREVSIANLAQNDGWPS